jgi:type VI secretion system protein ImpA
MSEALNESWLEPLADDVSGPDPEYDPAFLELIQAAKGRPETQFGPAEPPVWADVRDLANGLFDTTRDLRVAMLWARAQVNLEGLEGLGVALALLHALLDRFWNELHPRPDPDDGDTSARLSVLGGLDALDGLLGDVRQAQLLVDRRLGGLRVRDVEIALRQLTPRSEEATSTTGQIEGMLAEFPDLAERVRSSVESSLQSLKQLQGLMNERFDIDRAIDVKALRAMLTAVQSLLPATADATTEPVGGEESSNMSQPVNAGRRAGTAGGVHSVESRQDAVRAINLVCAYLERSEPTNPAQLLLRRAERLIDKNFLQLVRDFAPDAVNEVARILGVDPESLQDSGSY